MTEKIVLAYSGGLDTSVAIPWLKDKGYEVIAVVLNVGQPNADFDAIQQKALNVGALDSIVVDAQDEFADHYVAPVIKANALYEGDYPLVSDQLLARVKKLSPDFDLHLSHVVQADKPTRLILTPRN